LSLEFQERNLSGSPSKIKCQRFLLLNRGVENLSHNLQRTIADGLVAVDPLSANRKYVARQDSRFVWQQVSESAIR